MISWLCALSIEVICHFELALLLALIRKEQPVFFDERLGVAALEDTCIADGLSEDCFTKRALAIPDARPW